MAETGLARRGRPRDEGGTARVMAAARELLEQVGPSALTVKAVAARAGVSEPLVYRRWPSKKILLTELFVAMTDDLVSELPDVPFAELLETSLRDLISLLTSPGRGQLFLMLIQQAAHDEQLRAVLEEVSRRGAALRGALIGRARERGELTPGLDYDLVVEMAAALVYTRVLVTLDPIGMDDAAAITRTVLRAVGHRDRTAGRRGRMA